MSKVLSTASSFTCSLKGIRLYLSKLIPLKPMPAWHGPTLCSTMNLLQDQDQGKEGLEGVKVVRLAEQHVAVVCSFPA